MSIIANTLIIKYKIIPIRYVTAIKPISSVKTSTSTITTGKSIINKKTSFSTDNRSKDLCFEHQNKIGQNKKKEKCGMKRFNTDGCSLNCQA